MSVLIEEGHEHDPVTTLHQNKITFRQLASSLLLTSSFQTNKSKICKLRQEKPQQFHPLISPSALLTTNKLNIDSRHNHQESPNVYNNIQELKHLARRLEQDQVVKMGKENNYFQGEHEKENRTQEFSEVAPMKVKQRKLNKRKIVKGRPQMYAFMKKRKILGSLYEQKQTNSQNNLPYQAHIKQTINQILNKDGQDRFACTKYDQRFNENSYGSHLREPSQELTDLPPRNKRIRLRRSLSSIKALQNHEKKAQFGLQTPLVKGKERQLSLGNKRFSSSNTIQ